MSNESDDKKSDQLSVRQNWPEILQIGRGAIDVSSLPEEARNALKIEYAKGMIQLDRQAQEMGIATGALDKRIGDINSKVSDATRSGISATVTTVVEDSMGRTEVIVGNTEHAARGKLDRSQKGQGDQTLTYIVIIGIVVVIVALIMAT